MSEFTKLSLIKDIHALGIVKGDTVLLRGALSKVGKITRIEFLDAFIECVGPSGTIVVLGFTKSFKYQRSDAFRNYVFDTATTKPNIGAVSTVVFDHKAAHRSRHPTNSFIALGANAREIVTGHDESALSYTPIAKLIDANAKMVLTGCVEESPGFTTVHYNQELLGLTKRSWLAGVYRYQYKKIDGSIGVFVRNDFGGCSAGFGKFYKDYRDAGLLTEGKIGNAITYCIDAKSAFDVENKILRSDPRYFLCDNPRCLGCRVGWKFNKRDIIKFLYTSIRMLMFRSN